MYTNQKSYKIPILFFSTGEHDFNKPEGTETSIGVSKIIIHPGFTWDKLDKDIALLKTDRPIPFGKYVGTICLPDHKQEVPVGTKCTITGMIPLYILDSPIIAGQDRLGVNSAGKF